MRKLIIPALLVALIAAACTGGDPVADPQASDGEPAANETPTVAPMPSVTVAEAPSTGVRETATGAAPFAAQVGTVPNPGITVSGTGLIAGEPDTLTVTVGVGVSRSTVDAALEQANVLAEQLISAVKSFGVADEDIQTANFSIFPEYDFRNDTRRIIGYRVDNTLNVKIRDIDAAGEIIGAAAGVAGDEVVVQNVRFAIEDNAELLASAREAAWADAAAKAAQLADLSGVALGAPVSIQETVSSTPPITRDARTSQAFAAEFDVPIEAGSETVAVIMVVTFAIG